jgi:hypothetical protein
VLLRVVERLAEDGTPVLPLSLSHTPPFESASRFGESLGLRASPVAALRAISSGKPAVLLIDQLDAVRITGPASSVAWDVANKVMRDAMHAPDITLIVACRSFDLENDPNISSWIDQAKRSSSGSVVTFDIGQLAEKELRGVLRQLGVPFDSRSPKTKSLLRHPGTLDAWHRLISAGSQIREFANRTALLNALIRELRQKAVREHAVDERAIAECLASVRDHMQHSGQLSLPMSAVGAVSRASCPVA